MTDETEDLKAQAFLLDAAGMSQVQAAAQLGISRSRLRRLIGTPGVNGRKPAVAGEAAEVGELESTPLAVEPAVAEHLNGAGPMAAALSSRDDLITDDLARAIAFRDAGDLAKATVLIDRAKVRGASDDQLRAAFPNLTSGSLAGGIADVGADARQLLSGQPCVECEKSYKVKAVGVLLGLAAVMYVSYRILLARQRRAEPAADTTSPEDVAEEDAVAVAVEVVLAELAAAGDEAGGLSVLS